MMVIVNSPSRTFQQTIALYLGKNGAKIIVFLNKKDKKSQKVSISLRQSKKNTPAEIEYLRLDLLAKKLNSSGGGHAEAAGSATENLPEAFSILNDWAIQKQLDMEVINYSETN